MNGNTTIRLKIIQSKKGHLFLERKGLFNSYIYVSINLLQQENLPVNHLYTIIKHQNTQNKCVSMSLIKCFSTIVLLLTVSHVHLILNIVFLG